MGNINTSGCYLINGIQFACSNDAGLIDLYNISTINGLPPGSGGGDGSGMPQTPWFSNINAANYNLYNLSLLNGQPVNLVPDYSTAFPGDILTIGPTGVPEWDPPNISQDQTPWLQDVDAANFSLSNLTNLNGLPVSYYLQSPWVQPVNAAGNALYNVPVLQFPNGTQLYSNSTTGALLLWGTSVGEVARAPFGISSSSSFLPQYPLDVVGNANISGCYYIQGIALACYNSGAAGFDLTNINTINGLPPGSGGGQNQTPWQSNIDANNYNLYNLNCVVLGTITPGPFYICIDINGSAQYSNKNQSGVIWMTQSGFLGIGIQQPPYPLDVYSPQDYSARIRSHTSFCGLIIDHDLTSGGESIVSFRSANNEAAIIQYDSDEDALIFWTGARDAANSTLTCDTNSRVGILTTSPLYELDVNGDCNISGTYRVNGVPLSTGGGFWQGGSNGAIYYNGGNVGIGTASPKLPIHIANQPNNSMVVEGAGGYYQIWKDDTPTEAAAMWGYSPLAIGTYNGVAWEQAITIENGTPSYTLYLNASGNVGIGTATPLALLDVNGFIRSTSANGSPTSGTGIELLYSGGNGIVQAYDRDTSAFVSLQIAGYPVTVVGHGYISFNPNHEGYVSVGTPNPRTWFTVIPGANPTSWQDSQLCIGEVTDNGAYGLYLNYNMNGNIAGLIQAVSGSQANTLLLNPYGGNVGIGTTSPQGVLHVHEATNQNIVLSGGTGTANIQATNDAVNAYVPLSITASSVSIGQGVVNVSTGPLCVGTGTSLGNMSPGDIGVSRNSAPNQGVIYFGNGNPLAYLYFNGTTWVFSPALPSSGGGPTTQNIVTGSRSIGAIYQNTTGKPMYITVSFFPPASQNIYMYCDASSNPTTTVIWEQSGTTAQSMTFNFIALPNYFYRLNASGGSIYSWVEWD